MRPLHSSLSQEGEHDKSLVLRAVAQKPSPNHVEHSGHSYPKWRTGQTHQLHQLALLQHLAQLCRSWTKTDNHSNEWIIPTSNHPGKHITKNLAMIIWDSQMVGPVLGGGRDATCI